MEKLLASIELGGTKALAAVATDPLAPLMRTRVPTTDPASTLDAIAGFFTLASEQYGRPAALGIASFGPIDIRADSSDWGRIGTTTKPGWEGANPAEYLGERLGCLVTLDTDVNAAALAEARWGAGRGLDDIAYLTIGTGVGGGLIVAGRPVHGALHPEVGHVPLRRHPNDDYRGRCSFHGDCAEGLASGPAIVERYGKPLDELGRDHPFRAILADYLGQVCAILVLVTSPRRIVIGGGVMAASGLHSAVEQSMIQSLGGYLSTTAPDGAGFVVPPALGDDAGLAGGFALAQDLLRV